MWSLIVFIEGHTMWSFPGLIFNQQTWTEAWCPYQETHQESMVPRWPTFRDGSTKWSALPIFFIPTWRAWGPDFFGWPFSWNIEKTASEILLGSPSTRWNMTALQNWEILYCLPRQYLDQHSAMLERNAVMPLGFPVNSRSGVSAVPWHPKASSVLLDMFKTCLENIKLLGCPT